MTALATPPTTSRYLPAANGSVDRAIRVSTAVVVLAVAGIAAYISYRHAYAVVREYGEYGEYGETGVTAQLEPARIDGLVYASSMVILYAARHRLPVPRLARWMLALGILASLAVNVAQGRSHGLVGAVVAAWPAVSLVGSYELLAWMVRTAATGLDHAPLADQQRLLVDHRWPPKARAARSASSPWRRSPNWRAVLDAGPARCGYEDQRWTLARVADQVWGRFRVEYTLIAIDHRGEVRERRADDACADPGCGHREIGRAHV